MVEHHSLEIFQVTINTSDFIVAVMSEHFSELKK